MSRLNSIQVRSLCFSSFDFTPEDVFVSEAAIKYADPVTSVVGIPIIDLACFSGVARDAYQLPGSAEGHDILYSYAIEHVSSILGINSTEAIRIWHFGRALQCALSARFRIDSDEGKSMSLTQLSEDHLRMFLE